MIEAFSFPVTISDVKESNVILIKIENNIPFFKWDNSIRWEYFDNQTHSSYDELIEFYNKHNVKKLFEIYE